MSKKPVIGVTGSTEGGTSAWIFTALSVRLAGGRPVRIRPLRPCAIDKLEGLILGGGADVEPARYGQQRQTINNLTKDELTLSEWLLSLLLFPIYWTARYIQRTRKSPVDKDRDELELRLLGEAVAREMPVLGICRGMQLMNIHFHGSLHQDIRGFYGEKPNVSSIFPKKRVVIDDGSKLRELLRTRVCKVNALHHQAINQVGKSLRSSAREMDTGIIQAIEHTRLAFMIGVQWHPEYLIQIPRQRRLFKRLVQAAI